MDLTVTPMLARLARALPRGEGWRYEPRWDGFRCLAFRAGCDIDLRSRNGRPLARYFPEVVDALSTLGSGDVALDGELLVPGPVGFDFDTLLRRLHPAARRVELRSTERPATYVSSTRSPATVPSCWTGRSTSGVRRCRRWRPAPRRRS